MKRLARVKRHLQLTRYFTYMFVSVWKIIAFVITSFIILHVRGENIGHVISMSFNSFQHQITIQAVKTAAGGSIPDLLEIIPNGDTEIINNQYKTQYYVLLIHVVAAWFAYTWGKSKITDNLNLTFKIDSLIDK